MSGQRNFDRIICLLDEWYRWGLSAHSIWYITNITEMSWEMVQHIWPANTENQLADILIEAHRLLIGYEEAGQPFKEDKNLYFDYCDHLEREAYRSSWLFKCVTDLFNQGRYTGERYNALRKVFLTFRFVTVPFRGGEKMPKMLTPADIAKILQVSYDTALHFIKHSGIAYTKIGRQYRVNADALDAVLSQDDTIIVTFDE